MGNNARLADADLTVKIVLEPDTLVCHRFLWDLTLSLATNEATEPVRVRVPLSGLFMYSPEPTEPTESTETIEPILEDFFTWLPTKLDPRRASRERMRSVELMHDALRARGENDDATAKALNEAMVVDPTHAAPPLYLGDVRRDHGDDPGAERAYRKAIAVAETEGDRRSHTKAREGLVSLLAKVAQESDEPGQVSGRCREVLALVDKLLANKPDHFRALYHKGHCLALMGETAPAIKALRRAIEIRPTSEAYEQLVQIHESSGDHARALEIAHDAIDASHVASSWCLLGDVHLRSKELAHAQHGIPASP